MSKSKSKKIWISVIAVILVVAGASAFYYKDWIKAYYQDFNTNNYHYGDTVEINDKYRSIAESNGIDIFRIVKSGDIYDIVLVKAISGNKIKQSKITQIGIYLYSKVLPLLGPDNKPIMTRVYAIKPNLQLAEDYPDVDTSLKPIDDKYYTLATPVLSK